MAYQADQADAAIEYCSQALEIEANQPETWRILGLAFHNARKRQRAAEAASALIVPETEVTEDAQLASNA